MYPNRHQRSLLASFVNLPRWAALIPPVLGVSAVKDALCISKEDELEEEEIYTRKRSFHTLLKQMDEAMDDVLAENLSPCLFLLEDFLDAASPKLEQNPRQKRQKIPASSASQTRAVPCVLGGLDTTLFDQQQQTEAPHDPLLLPVIMLQGPSFGADRRAQLNCLANNLQKTRCRSAVFQVQLSTQHCFNGMRELLRQCHVLSPVLASIKLSRRLVKREKKKTCVISNLLLMWAQNVSGYDEIVLFFNADEGFCSTDLQDVLHSLAITRAEQGIPVFVVFLGPPEGRRFMELKSSLQGYSGCMIRSLALPSCERLLNDFRKRLCIQLEFTLLPRNVRRAIERSFFYHHKSSQRTMRKLQQVLAYNFLQKGSFLAVAHNASVLKEIWQSLAWFLSAAGAKVQLIGATPIKATSKQTLEALEAHCNDYTQLSLHLMDSIQSGGKNASHLLFQHSFFRSRPKKSRRDVLEELMNWRKQIDQSNGYRNNPRNCQSLLTKYVCCFALNCADQLVHDISKAQAASGRIFINEFILLIGKCRDGDDLSEVERLFDKAFADRVRRSSTADSVLFPGPVHETLSRKRPADMASCEWAVETIASQPRKQIMASLRQTWVRVGHWTKSENGAEGMTSYPLAFISGIMYSLIHDGVAVTSEDWFQQFLQYTMVARGVNCRCADSFSLFSLGLRCLEQCGLIVANVLVGSARDIIYERAKLVWCA